MPVKVSRYGVIYDWVKDGDWWINTVEFEFGETDTQQRIAFVSEMIPEMSCFRVEPCMAKCYSSTYFTSQFNIYGRQGSLTSNTSDNKRS